MAALPEASSSSSSSSPPREFKEAQLQSMNVVVCTFALSIVEKQIFGNQTRS
jgi:hypothetical protein